MSYKEYGGNLLIRGGTIVSPERVYKADILIEGGIIRAIGMHLTVNDRGFEVIDATGKLVFPGAVDEHVHFREPGYEYKDDIETSSKAAAVGGVTTVFDMPNTNPPVINASTLREKARMFSAKSYVDFALYGALFDSNLEEVPNLINEGAIGLKAYLAPTRGWVAGDVSPPSLGTIYTAMQMSAKLGFPIIFHAEDKELIEAFTERVRKSSKTGVEALLEARPPIAEEVAIRKIATVVRHTGGKAVIAHVSSMEALEAIKEAKHKGINIYAETCPHYLIFDVEDYRKHGPLIKVHPPIRGKQHRLALLEGIREGHIDTIASDHAPHTLEEKAREDILEALPGIGGIQTSLVVMLDLSLRDLLPLTLIPTIMARNPAKIYGIWPKKGEIAVGSDGDLVIVDPNKSTFLQKENLIAKHHTSPYIGMTFRGKIVHTIIRGIIVASEGQLAIDKPIGLHITRHAFVSG